MPTIFVPEAAWAPHTWGVNEARTVALQREYALDEKGYGYWGFSPSACPGEGYSVFGVPPIAWVADGYPSELDGEVVVTPHASAMALMVEPDEATDNLVRHRARPRRLRSRRLHRRRRHAYRPACRSPPVARPVDGARLPRQRARRRLPAPLVRTPEVEAVLRPVVAARRMPLT